MIGCWYSFVGVLRVCLRSPVGLPRRVKVKIILHRDFVFRKVSRRVLWVCRGTDDYQPAVEILDLHTPFGTTIFSAPKSATGAACRTREGAISPASSGIYDFDVRDTHRLQRGQKYLSNHVGLASLQSQ